MQEVQLIIATIARRYRLKMIVSDPVESAPLVTLRPVNGLNMTIEAREGKWR